MTNREVVIDRAHFRVLCTTGQRVLTALFLMTIVLWAGPVMALLPVTGVPVAELTAFDDAMQTFMSDYGLEGGVLAVSKDGCVVYQRGFGYAFNTTDPLPENTPMRLASVEKPLAAAAVQYLVADGVISMDDFVFDVGLNPEPNTNGERLLLDASTPSSPYYPYDSTFTDQDRLGHIRVRHLIDHLGGWDRQISGDPMSRGWNITIGDATGHHPPGREWTVKYMMSQELQFDPGDPTACDKDADDNCLGTLNGQAGHCLCDRYSNFGYMLLSLIVLQESGMEVVDFVHQRVLTPAMWVPSTEIIFGRSFRVDQSPREPYYIHGGGLCTNVVNPGGTDVECPYGGYDHESKTGEGNLVGSAAPLMTFLDRYHADTFGTDIGVPIGSPVDGWKNGGLWGTSTVVRQRADGINIAVLFNEDGGDGGRAQNMEVEIKNIIDGGGITTWPTRCVDGFWLDFTAASPGFGGHDDTFDTLDTALTETRDGTKLHIKPGTTDWTGTMDQRMMIDAPFGEVTIGTQAP